MNNFSQSVMIRTNKASETVTALTKVTEDLKTSSDSQSWFYLIPLIFIQRLHDSVGLTGQVPDWFTSQLKGQTFNMLIDYFRSAQASVRGSSRVCPWSTTL